MSERTPATWLRDLPSSHQGNFASITPKQKALPVYIATHSRTQPPPDQVVSSKHVNVFLQHVAASHDTAKRRASSRDEKEDSGRAKLPRAAQPRPSASDDDDDDDV